MRRWLGRLADLLLPALCPGCGIACGPTLCPACRAGLPQAAHACGLCAAVKPPTVARCPTCLDQGWPHLHAVHACLGYHAQAQQLVNLAKAGGSSAAVACLATLFVELLPLATLPRQNAIVTSLPPNPGRRAGPHLATALGKALAHALGLRWQRTLRLTRPAAEQHRLNAASRRRNVEGLFAPLAPLGQKTVLLIDDLLTSGATLQAAAATLHGAGARQIWGLVMARTPRHDEPALVYPFADQSLVAPHAKPHAA